jgi:radical SAM protein with 4Fe4S-binding SPASM domain
VLYLGGEPLMNKHLVEMCRRVKQETSVVRTLITTNAMLLDEKACAGLETAMLDRILVSVDGRSPEENDAIRVRAKYSEIVENVARLRRHLAGTGTGITISHSMFRQEGDPENAQTPEFLKRDFPGLPIWSDYATRWPGFDVEKSSVAAAGLKVMERRNFCDFPFFELSVRANGDVVLCCHDLLGEGVMGSVYKDDLRSIWNAHAYRELRRAMLDRDEQRVHPVCRKCFVFTGERIVQEADALASGIV